MRRSNMQNHKSSRSKNMSEAKNNISKNKYIKNCKSIEKAQQLKDSQYLFQLRPPNQLKKKQNGENTPQVVMKFQKPEWCKRFKDQNVLEFGKKINSDEESTNANGLLQSGQLYQNFLQRNRADEVKQKNVIKEAAQKSRKASQTNSLKQSLKSRIEQFKLLQKVHEDQSKQLKNRLTSEEAHRLQKIQRIEKGLIHREIISLEKMFKSKETKQDLKYSHQLTIQRK